MSPVERVKEQISKLPTTNLQIVSGLCMAWCAFWFDALTDWTMSYEILLLITAHIVTGAAQHYGKRKTQFTPTEIAMAKRIDNGECVEEVAKKGGFGNGK